MTPPAAEALRQVEAGEPPEAGGGADVPEDAPTSRMVVAILSLMGFFVALYMFAYAIGLLGEVVCGVGDCATVQASPWSKIGPIPVAAFGVVGYALMLGLALYGLQPAGRGSRAVPPLLLGGGVIGVGFSAYLTWLEAFRIGAWCQWCVVSAIIMTLIFVACLPEVRRLGGGR